MDVQILHADAREIKKAEEQWGLNYPQECPLSRRFTI